MDPFPCCGRTCVVAGIRKERSTLSHPIGIQIQIPSINQSISQSINQSINRSINPSIHPSIHQSINRSIKQSINQSIINHHLSCTPHDREVDGTWIKHTLPIAPLGPFQIPSENNFASAMPFTNQLAWCFTTPGHYYTVLAYNDLFWLADEGQKSKPITHFTGFQHS